MDQAKWLPSQVPVDVDNQNQRWPGGRPLGRLQVRRTATSLENHRKSISVDTSDPQEDKSNLVKLSTTVKHPEDIWKETVPSVPDAMGRDQEKETGNKGESEVKVTCF